MRRFARLLAVPALALSVPGVAQAMAVDMGWDERRVEAEAGAFLDEAAAEGIVAGAS